MTTTQIKSDLLVDTKQRLWVIEYDKNKWDHGTFRVRSSFKTALHLAKFLFPGAHIHLREDDDPFHTVTDDEMVKKPLPDVAPKTLIVSTKEHCRLEF